MFKLLFFCVLLLVLFNHVHPKDPLDSNDLQEAGEWPNLWFPYPPNYKKVVVAEKINTASENNESSAIWTGLWFPYPPNYAKDGVAKESGKAEIGKEPYKKNSSELMDFWHPHTQNNHGYVGNINAKDNMQVIFECDNGKNDIGVDFDPEDKRHSYNYLCLDKRSEYAPNLNVSALLQEHMIPVAYKPPIKCLNESIDYSESLPTFGAYRPLASKFGTYKYLPPQRWLHSLADGAIVLLHHPCAFAGQIEQLKSTLKGCLYRHIITPSQQLSPERPLALLAWGKSLQMSVVDDAIVVKFIKENAKLGFKQKQQRLKLSLQTYDAALLAEAHLVTDEQDKEVCGFKEMR